jgi:hypothetical protein
MPEWYAGIDYVLSTSDFESFHFTVADGTASGCMPIILPWEGADEIYPKEWVVNDAPSASIKIKRKSLLDASVKGYAHMKFDLKRIASAINDEVILGVIN